MRIRFDEIQEITIPHLNNSKGSVSAKTLMDSSNRIMVSRLPAGASIGLHFHSDSSEVKLCKSQTM